MITMEMRGAWRELERKLRPFVARRVAGADAEDVLQDIFLRMQKSLPPEPVNDFETRCCSGLVIVRFRRSGGRRMDRSRCTCL
jgi:DNA-directed RNA polymerase specialized sigma24 family protein